MTAKIAIILFGRFILYNFQNEWAKEMQNKKAMRKEKKIDMTKISSLMLFLKKEYSSLEFVINEKKEKQ